MKKILRWFLYITVVFYLIGSVIEISNNQANVYTIWMGAAFITAVYLLESKE